MNYQMNLNAQEMDDLSQAIADSIMFCQNHLNGLDPETTTEHLEVEQEIRRLRALKEKVDLNRNR